METVLKYWPMILAFLNIAVIPLLAVMMKKHRQTEERQQALELGLQALLRDRIVQAYYHYTEEGRGRITLHGLENVNAMYEQYHALGGNGTITELVEKMRSMEVRDE